MAKVKLGKKVPDFTATATNDSVFTLSENMGKNIVIYFYPKDNTPGCTKESEDFRDQFEVFNSNNTVIVGVSRDSVKSHEKFIEIGREEVNKHQIFIKFGCYEDNSNKTPA